MFFLTAIKSTFRNQTDQQKAGKVQAERCKRLLSKSMILLSGSYTCHTISPTDCTTGYHLLKFTCHQMQAQLMCAWGLTPELAPSP